MINYLYKNDTFMTYQELVDQFNMKGKGELWKYFQLRSCMGSQLLLNRGTEESNMIQRHYGLPCITWCSTKPQKMHKMINVRTLG